MTKPTRQDLILLRSCTASVDLKLDCERALRGDEEALERCAVIVRRARPSGFAQEREMTEEWSEMACCLR